VAAARPSPVPALRAGPPSPAARERESAGDLPKTLGRRGERRVLVTRPEPEAARLADALKARGVEAVIEPLLTIEFAADGAAILAALLPGTQAVLFTSANGVRALAAATSERGLPAFAVGDRTAAAARDAGFASVTSAGGSIEDLARLILDRLRPGVGPLLHAAGSAVAGDLAARLAPHGFALRRAVLYEARPATALSAATQAALRAGGLWGALFFSPRTAATFVSLAAAAGLADRCGQMIALALSPAVATALGGIAWREIRVADTPEEAALLSALDQERR
jgi:uroporphyrinogen-III synthase